MNISKLTADQVRKAIETLETLENSKDACLQKTLDYVSIEDILYNLHYIIGQYNTNAPEHTSIIN